MMRERKHGGDKKERRSQKLKERKKRWK